MNLPRIAKNLPKNFTKNAIIHGSKSTKMVIFSQIKVIFSQIMDISNFKFEKMTVSHQKSAIFNSIWNFQTISKISKPAKLNLKNFKRIWKFQFSTF